MPWRLLCKYVTNLGVATKYTKKMATRKMTQPEKKPRKPGSGAKPGDGRKSGRKPTNPEGARVKASPTFLPSHWAAIQADGRGVTACLDEALALWIEQPHFNL